MPLIGQSVRDDVVFVAFGAILLAVLLCLLRTVCSRPAFSQVMAHLKAVIRAIRAWDGMAVNEVDLIVRDKLKKQKVDHFRKTFQISSIILVPSTLNTMINIMNHNIRTYSLTQDIVYLLLHGITTLVLIHPSVLSWRTLDLFYTILLMLLGAYTAPFACRPEFLGDALQIVAFAMAIMTFLRRTSTPLVPILNVLVTAAACSSIWVHGEGLFLRRPIAMALHTLAAAFVTIVAHMLEKGSIAMMRQCMEMQDTKEVLSACMQLLRSYCDVVVDLDSEGTIVSPAIDLGSFLLRGPGQCLQGWKLADLMTDEADRRSFMGRLLAPAPGGMAFAEAFHTSMKDGNGDILELELLWFQFRHLNHRPYYMVGIREFRDEFVSRCQQQGQDAEDLASNGDLAVSQDEEGSSLPEAASVSVSSLGELAAVAVVDTSKDGLPIRGLSSGFCRQIGRLPVATPLAHFVRSRVSFPAWVQRSINAMIAGDAETEDFGVCLRMPQGEMQATCRILPDKSRDSMQEMDQDRGAAINIRRVRLLFSGVSLCHSHSTHSDASQLKGTPISLMPL